MSQMDPNLRATLKFLKSDRQSFGLAAPEHKLVLMETEYILEKNGWLDNYYMVLLQIASLKPLESNTATDDIELYFRFGYLSLH